MIRKQGPVYSFQKRPGKHGAPVGVTCIDTEHENVD